MCFVVSYFLGDDVQIHYQIFVNALKLMFLNRFSLDARFLSFYQWLMLSMRFHLYMLDSLSINNSCDQIHKRKKKHIFHIIRKIPVLFP